MSTAKDLHIEKKNKILELLKDTGEYFSNSPFSDRTVVFNDLYKNVNEGNFLIVVVGEFSAGKSTFLNALMQERYLPSFTGETTATINFLRHTDCSETGDQIAIFYKDSDKKIDYIKEATLDNIENFVSTKNKTIKVAEEIRNVDLYLDSRFLKDGVTLVDSPGLNGLAEGHREMTIQQIEKSHACIFMFRANQPGAKTEFEFLDDLKSKSDTILFVLNRIDEVKSNEETVESVVEKLRENYRNKFPNDTIPEIFPVAGLPALVSRTKRYSNKIEFHGKIEHTAEEKVRYLQLSRMEEFEDRLWRFLTEGEKAKKELTEPVNRVIKILGEVKNQLESDIEDLKSQKSSEEVIKQIAEIEEELEKLEETVQSEQMHISESVSFAIRNIKESIRANIGKINDKYGRKISENDWIDPDEITSDINQIQYRLSSDVHLLINEIQDEFRQNLFDCIKTSMKENFLEIKKHLESDFTISNQISIDFNFEDFDFDFGIEDYRNQKKAIESELNSLNDDIDKADEAKYNSQRILDKKNMLEMKLEGIQQRRDTLELTLGSRPSVIKTARTATVERDRGGIAGWIIQKVIGPKEGIETVYDKDDSAQKEYDKNKADLSQRYEKELSQLESSINSMQDVEDPDKYDRQSRKLEELKMRKQYELNDLKEEFKKKEERLLKKRTNKVKTYISETIDSIETEIEQELYRSIRDKSEQFTGIVMDILEKKMSKKLQSKKEILERKKKDLESTSTERDSKIIEYTEQVEKIKNILTRAIEIEAEVAI